MFIRHVRGELTPEDFEFLGLDRQALHAWKLTVEHPMTGRSLEIEAPLYPDIASLLE